MKMKKMMAVSLSGLLAMTFMAGCGKTQGSEGKSSEGKTTQLAFAIWDSKQQAAMQKMAEAYTKEHPNVKIDVQLTPYKGGEYWTKLEAAMAGGTAPDVMWLNALHAESYVDGGMLLPLTEKIKEVGLDLDANFPKAVIDLYRLKGDVYAMPKDFDTNAVWYNKEIFDKAGIAYPKDGWTWDQMVEIAKKLTDKDKGIYGVAAPLDFQTCYYNTIFANGGWILNKDKTESGYADPKTQEGIQCWIDLINEGISPTLAQMTDTSADVMFESGKLAMCWAGSYMTPEYVNNDVVKDKIDLVALPSFKGKEANVLHGLGYAVYKNTKHKAEALDFVMWLGSEEANKIQGEAGVVIAARNDCQNLFAKAHPKYNLKAYTDKAAIATPLPVCLKASELYDIESQNLKRAYAGEISVKEACDKCAQEVNAILK